MQRRDCYTSPVRPGDEDEGVPTSDSESVPPFSAQRRRSLGPPDGHIPPRPAMSSLMFAEYHLLPRSLVGTPPEGSPSTSTLVLPSLSGIYNAHHRPARNCLLQSIIISRLPRPRPPEDRIYQGKSCVLTLCYCSQRAVSCKNTSWSSRSILLPPVRFSAAEGCSDCDARMRDIPSPSATIHLWVARVAGPVFIYLERGLRSPSLHIVAYVVSCSPRQRISAWLRLPRAGVFPKLRICSRSCRGRHDIVAERGFVQR